MGSAPKDHDQQHNSDKAPNIVNDATSVAKRLKREDVGDEEVVKMEDEKVVDIGDNEKPARNYPSIEIEKDNASLSSDSSSPRSSGSDSDISSSDYNGEEEAQSPEGGNSLMEGFTDGGYLIWLEARLQKLS